ncbi:28 kDa ribonucleoprotein, chloroplastic-like [Cicer arietinum]|uniref:28 kDa ribonucleoprotein, chloroplastic-like n=1 Tax=Cicer arietinum TaxID=3827 RepID=A0A3Q7XXP5_CICAR|nr:28 kDa ribonucleoprotein, chloroplastic-like [Cicer arietinum]
MSFIFMTHTLAWKFVPDALAPSLSQMYLPFLYLLEAHISNIIGLKLPNAIFRRMDLFATLLITWGNTDVSEAESNEAGSFEELFEDLNIFVANLPFDVDSEKLALLFEQVGTVEVAEVIYNRDIDRSRGFEFVTMSTMEEVENGCEL